MENIEKIIELADNEFGSVVKNGKFRSREEIDTLYKLMDIVKDGYCIMGWDESNDEESYAYDDGMSMRRGSGRGRFRGGAYDMAYEGNGSYARGRGRNARRDSMGRYSRDDGYRGGSYRRGEYSRGNDEYVEQLRDLMENAPDEQTRMGIKRMVDQIEAK